jgi:anti-sigma factor RsiW
VRSLLPSYVEGELAANDRERVAGHLQICSECRAEESRFRTSLGALAGYQPVAAPRSLYAGFAARLDAVDRAHRKQALRLRFAGAAACLLLVTAVSARPIIQRLISPGALESIDIVKPVASSKATITFNHPGQKVVHKVERPSAPQETAIVVPQPIEVEPAFPRMRSKREAVAAAPVDFLDVKPKVGPSARDQFASGVTRSRDLESDAVPVRSERAGDSNADAGFIAERNERIKVGDTLTTVKTGYQLDEDGRRTVVKVNIGTVTIP